MLDRRSRSSVLLLAPVPCFELRDPLCALEIGPVVLGIAAPMSERRRVRRLVGLELREVCSAAVRVRRLLSLLCEVRRALGCQDDQIVGRIVGPSLGSDGAGLKRVRTTFHTRVLVVVVDTPIWDHVQFFVPGERVPVADPWVALAAVALATNRVSLGPMVTPIARRRPWKLARECVTLDHLSGGRLILGVGLGDPVDTEFGAFGEETDARRRAQMLDEGLAVLTGLWRGEPFSFEGEHFQVRNALCWPPPVQSPRIPIWVAGWWPNKPPMRRGARWDGVFPGKLDEQGFGWLTPDDVREIVAYVRVHRETDAPFDVVSGGLTPGDDPTRAAEIVAPYAEAGLTWWHEGLPDFRAPLEVARARIRQGPPRLP